MKKTPITEENVKPLLYKPPFELIGDFNKFKKWLETDMRFNYLEHFEFSVKHTDFRIIKQNKKYYVWWHLY